MKHIISQYIPQDLEPNTIYISFEYGCAIHLCPCGCGNKAVTDFKPIWKDGWDLIIENDKVSLSPSILNRFPCKSHYYIKNSEIEWCK